ncbi:hypothetical protein QFC21_006171, partial [Naganishia friedmannii]
SLAFSQTSAAATSGNLGSSVGHGKKPSAERNEEMMTVIVYDGNGTEVLKVEVRKNLGDEKITPNDDTCISRLKEAETYFQNLPDSAWQVIGYFAKIVEAWKNHLQISGAVPTRYPLYPIHEQGLTKFLKDEDVKKYFQAN